TPGFLRYIERVLPSLGESGVVMLTPGELFPGVATFRHDEDDVARLKGDAAMAELLSRAVTQRQIVPRDDISLRIDGTPIRLTRDAIRAARGRPGPRTSPTTRPARPSSAPRWTGWSRTTRSRCAPRAAPSSPRIARTCSRTCATIPRSGAS